MENAGLKHMLLKINPKAIEVSPKLFQEELFLMHEAYFSEKRIKVACTVQDDVPHTPGAASSADVKTPTSFESTGDFENDPHRASPDGALVRCLEYESKPVQ